MDSHLRQADLLQKMVVSIFCFHLWGKHASETRKMQLIMAQMGEGMAGGIGDYLKGGENEDMFQKQEGKKKTPFPVS